MVKLNSLHSQAQMPPRLRMALLHQVIRARSGSLARNKSESGLTLIECLVAMIIITVTVAIITPPVFLAVGTRVNNRRTEQALQVAQGEIERVRLLMMSNQTFDDIKAFLPQDSGAGATQLQSAPVATALCGEGPPSPTNVCRATDLYQVPGNSGLYVQTFRDRGQEILRTNSAGVPQDELIAFNMGVRVYSQEAIDEDGNVPKALSAEEGAINFTSGTKTRGFRPLVTMYTEMIRSSQKESLTEMQEYTRDSY